MSDDIDYRALYEDEKRRREEAERRREEETRRREEETRRREEETRLREVETQLREEETRLLKEETRLRKEVERLRDEETRLREEVQRGLIASRLEAEQQRQGHQDAKAALARQQREMDTIRQGQASQALHPYIALVSRLHSHLTRLLPTRGRQAVQSTQSTSASSKSSATKGRTTIDGKFYPLKMRVWTEFAELHRRTFLRIMEADCGSLPSQQAIQFEEEALLRRIPQLYEPTSSFWNETRTSQYIDAALETPVSYILRQFLAAREARQQLYFLNDLGHREATSSGITIDTTTSDSANINLQSDSSGSTPSSARMTMTLRASPDCVVLVTPDEMAGLTASDPSMAQRRIAAGEHKPCHALRSGVAKSIFDRRLPETYMIRLASEARIRRAKSLQAQKARQPEQERAGSVDLGAHEDIEPPMPDEESKKPLPRQVYYAYALTQTYHYMLVSGIAYGYVATGETLTALHIPEDDPTCLLYHTSVFPSPTLAEADTLPDHVTVTPPLIETDPADTDALLALPIAQLCSLCVLAYETDHTLRDTDWTVTALQKLGQFPRKPNMPTEAHQDQPSSLGRRPRDDGDDNGDDDENDGGRSRRRLLQPPGNTSTHRGSQVRVPSPLQNALSVHEHSESTHIAQHQRQNALGARSRIRKPTLPYCTQVCLRGVAQDGPLDPKCPNVALHTRGQKPDVEGDAPGKHPITVGQIAELVKQQLLHTPQYDIECLYGAGFGGAIGHLFKISVTGYGYTFVAKAVQLQHRRRLRREERIYRALQEHQGSLIPVCLGYIELEAAYPLQDIFRVVTHMLLLSYGGVSVWAAEEAHQEAQQHAEGPEIEPLPWGDVDIKAETRRTLSTLRSAGLLEQDSNGANILWCDETRRVLKIDFDRASFIASKAQEPLTMGDTQKRRAHADDELLDRKRTRHNGEAAIVSVNGSQQELVIDAD